MRIVAINGSPKTGEGVSAMLIDHIERTIQTEVTVFHAGKMSKQEDLTQELNTIRDANRLLIVFPLYVDSLPAPLIEMFCRIEKSGIFGSESSPKVYALCNCGFYEAEHTSLALQMVERFACRVGLDWGYGLGIGSGGMLPQQAENMARGPLAKVNTALSEFCDDIAASSTSKQNVLVTPTFPRFLSSTIKLF